MKHGNNHHDWMRSINNLSCSHLLPMITPRSRNHRISRGKTGLGRTSRKIGREECGIDRDVNSRKRNSWSHVQPVGGVTGIQVAIPPKAYPVNSTVGNNANARLAIGVAHVAGRAYVCARRWRPATHDVCKTGQYETRLAIQLDAKATYA